MKTLAEAGVQPLDLLLFRGVDPVSKTIQFMERRKIGRGDYSHAGLAITREVLDLPVLDPGKIYVWESVLSASEGFWAKFSDQVPAAETKGVRFGVQLRDLELVIPAYMSDGGRVAWSAYRGERPPIEQVRETLQRMHAEYGRARYTTNLLEVVGVVFPELRSARDRMNRLHDRTAELANRLLSRVRRTEAEAVLDADHHVFCSEWVARVYQALGILEVRDPRLAAPVHFLSRTSLFADPEPLVPQGYEGFRVEERDLLPRPERSEESIRERTMEASFLRHRALRERIRAYAEDCGRGVSATDDGRVAIEFGAAETGTEAELDAWVRESDGLDVERRRAPVAVGDEPPPLSIAIAAAGPEEVVRPVVAIGRRLADDGHRVRLGTHADLREMVDASGLEFHPLAGRSHELIGDLDPRSDVDAADRRRRVAELVESIWSLCSGGESGHRDAEAFRADALIATPAAQGQVHVAEALQIPLQIFTSMPLSPTRAFAHPLARVEGRVAAGLRNRLSYGVMQKLLWETTSEPVTRLRERLDLPRLGMGEGPGLIEDRMVPLCYLWPPPLLEPPADWGAHVDIADTLPVDREIDFEPPPELARFLEEGEPPICLGLPREASPELWRTVFDALATAGRRGVVAVAGAELPEAVPEHIHVAPDCPLEWLVPRCRAVCHSGDLPSTTLGLAFGRPTLAVPFAGAQSFWAERIARVGAGPAPIAARDLRVDLLADAFRACDRPELRSRAQELGETIGIRDGAALAVKAFYRSLPTTADGLLSYLGFDPGERERLRAGELISHDLMKTYEYGSGFVLAGRIDRPLDAVYEDCLAGRILDQNPVIVAFGTLPPKGATIEDFARVGYEPDEAPEVAELLRATPAAPFNLSGEELERVRELGKRFPEATPGPAAIDAASEVLRRLLLGRARAYAEKGLEGLAPYVREEGESTRPDELLRCALPPDSVVAEDLPELRRVLLDYPESDPRIEHRFYWTKESLAGHPTFSLLHHLLRLGDGIALVVARHYYLNRELDVTQILAGLVPTEKGTLVLCSHRMSASQLSGTWLRPDRRLVHDQLEEAATRILEALRSSG